MKKNGINFDEVFKLYYRPLCLYAIHYVRDVDIAEDIVQDCLSLLWEKGGEVEHLKSYLYVMVRNYSLNYLKREAVFDMNCSPSDLEETLPDEELEEYPVMEARMWTAIDALPERCREVFLLHKRDGMTYKEIAELLHISVHTVDNHICKALRLVREGVKALYSFFFG